MPNFFTDNADIRFVFDHLNLAEVARAPERGMADTRRARRQLAAGGVSCRFASNGM